MDTIFKYKLKTVGTQVIKMPKGARMLSVQVQDNVPCLWALVCTESEMTDRVFDIYGTGNVCLATNLDRFIGTYQELNGQLVWHLFERNGNL